MSTTPVPIRKRMTAVDVLIRYRTIAILLLLIAAFTILKDIFILPTNLLNMLKRMSFVAITAFGMTFVITLGGLDLSVGGTAAIVGVGFALMLGMGIPVVVALVLCLLIAVALGAINGVIIVKGRIEPFLVTLATMNIFRGIALMATGGRPVPIVSEAFITIFRERLPVPCHSHTRSLSPPSSSAASLLLYKKTKFGFYVRAIGGNLEAARVAGINIQSVKFLTYIINGVFAFFAGLILSALMSSGLPNIADGSPPGRHLRGHPRGHGHRRRVRQRAGNAGRRADHVDAQQRHVPAGCAVSGPDLREGSSDHLRGPAGELGQAKGLTASRTLGRANDRRKGGACR